MVESVKCPIDGGVSVNGRSRECPATFREDDFILFDDTRIDHRSSGFHAFSIIGNRAVIRSQTRKPVTTPVILHYLPVTIRHGRQGF